MGAIDEFAPGKAAGAGAVLVGANPKNLLLAVATAAAIAQTGISGGEQAIAYTSRPHVAVLGRSPGKDGQRTDLQRHPRNEQIAGVVVLRPEAGLFFANADWVREHIRAHAESARAIVLDSESMPFVDVTAVRMLAELTEDVEQRGVRLLVARDLGQVRDVVHRTDEGSSVRLYPSVEAALDAVRHSDGGDAR